MVQTSLAVVAQSQPTSSQYLTFTLAGESFAIPIEHVREIIEFCSLTSIPLMPPFLRGIINLRGAVVPVVDLQARFGRANTEIAKRTCIVIVELEEASEMPSIGIMVDSVNEVITTEPGMLEAKPSFGAQIRDDFVAGILNQDGRFTITLDMRRVLSLDELAALIAMENAQSTLTALNVGSS